MKNKSKIEALGARVIVMRDDVQEESSGGIILPTDQMEEANMGTVVGVGEDCKILKEGDRVFVQRNTGYPFALGGVTALVFMEEEIMVRIL